MKTLTVLCLISAVLLSGGCLDTKRIYKEEIEKLKEVAIAEIKKELPALKEEIKEQLDKKQAEALLAAVEKLEFDINKYNVETYVGKFQAIKELMDKQKAEKSEEGGTPLDNWELWATILTILTGGGIAVDKRMKAHIKNRPARNGNGS